MSNPDIPMLSTALTQRERAILRLLAQGFSDREIAETMFITVGTVKWYNRQIYSKLGVHNRTQAITAAQRTGLLEDAPLSSTYSAPAKAASYLPAQVTSFIGRSDELQQVQRLVRGTRLVTLTGPPGAGKTRLALEAASLLAEEFHDGVYFVSLASLFEPDLVINSIAQALNVSEAGSHALLSTLQAHLRTRQLLLVLDNFEHLLTAAPRISELLAAAPQLKVLVTSRELLRLYGEYEFPVPPLQLPDLKQPLESSEAVELFVQRAQAASPNFTLDQSSSAAVATICVHLDGLPLAIELAAARVKFYAPQTLLLHLSSRLEMLTDGPRDLPLRQRTLRATLTWSYELLDEEEKILLARLAIFAGGCTLEDADAICGDGLSVSMMSALESLLNKNLLRQEQGMDSQSRFMMLEMMREYALEKLNQRDEVAAVSARHAQHFLTMAENAALTYYGSEQSAALLRLESNHDNLRSALRWYLTTGDSQTSLHFIGSVARFWEVRGHLSEGRSWLVHALALDGASARTKARADALRGTAEIMYLQSDYGVSQELFEEALAIYRALDEQSEAAHTLVSLGEIATEVGDYDSAPIIFQKAYDIMRQIGDARGSARALTQLGWGALRTGDYDRAHQCLQEGLGLFIMLDDKVSTALTYSGLGEIAVRKHELDSATILLEKSLLTRRELGEKWGIAASLGSLAWVALLQNDFRRAADILRESLHIRKEIGDVGGMAWCLEKFAEMAQLSHDAGRAVRLFGAAAALRAPINSVIDPSDQPHYQRIIKQLNVELSSSVFDALWAEGQSMTLQQILDYALPAASGIVK